MANIKSIFMRTLILVLCIVCMSCSTLMDQSNTTSGADSTTVYLVRHTEKDKDGGKDPALTEQGKFRAEYWASVLQNIELDAIYSTDTTRTRDTAAPTALSKGKQVEIYNGREVDYAGFVQANLNQSVLVVGHSNTIPAFVNGLLGVEQYQDLDESSYSSLFIVDIINGQGTAKKLNVEIQFQESLVNRGNAMPEHEKINYLEYAASDLQATKEFFTKAFDWGFEDYGPDYTAFTGQGVDGGFFRADMASTTLNGGALTVFYSDDLETTLQKVEASGGVVIKPIFSFPGGRRFHFTEPSGNEFAVWGQ